MGRTISIELGNFASIEKAAEVYNTPAFIELASKLLVDRAHELWIDVAGKKLKTSQSIYIEAIGDPVRLSQGEWLIPFVGPNAGLAAMIEFGNDVWDMKNALEGKVVPFEHHAQFSRSNFGLSKPLGAGFQKSMGRQAAVAHGKKIEKLFLAGQTKDPIFKKRADRGHRGGLYEGMKSSGATEFITFRTVGEFGWEYPARDGEQLTKSVKNTLELEAPELLKDVVEAFVAHIPAAT